jgi:hypothetical protein
MVSFMVLLSWDVPENARNQGLSSAIDNRVGVGFPFGNSAFAVLKTARFGELFL